ncbi:MAG: SUMF1/EgtB/PvdO family nonheme iron enzyme [Acidobacteriota bacterium]
MDHQVFISYSSQDKELADRVCAALENTGVSCWIAPRDIEAGAGYPNAILLAIKSVKSVVVLLTSVALASPHILSEIGHAFNAKKPMLPVRLSSSDLPPDFDYFLSTQQWLDASGGFTDETLKRVIDAVSGTLVEQQDLDRAARRRKRRMLIAAALAMVLAAAGIVAYSRRPALRTPEPGVTASVAPSANTVPPATIASPEPKTEPKLWLNPKDGLKYVWIPPGTFTMGCSAADNECQDNEKPAHRVNIPAGFWLSQTEVTNAAYRKVLPAKASAAEGDGALPMRGLSWPEAQAYCSATGGRLPTEAEWEYAARGGIAEPYYGVPSNIAWYEKDSGQHTHPAGLKEPNRFGLYDMLGNVSEWVLDRYYNKYDVEANATGAHIDQPLAGNSSAVARGGFWDAELPSIRVSHRSEMPHDERVETAGVRCANDHSAP